MNEVVSLDDRRKKPVEAVEAPVPPPPEAEPNFGGSLIYIRCRHVAMMRQIVSVLMQVGVPLEAAKRIGLQMIDNAVMGDVPIGRGA